jgi:PIN domain nuclease of toxin-antitoxin system
VRIVAGSERLSPEARRMLSENRGAAFVSAISAFEVGIKHRQGKLRLPLEPVAWFHRAVTAHGFRETPVSGRIAALSTQLPPLHADPADRMIVATAQVQGMTILTPDVQIERYPDVRIAW